MCYETCNLRANNNLAPKIRNFVGISRRASPHSLQFSGFVFKFSLRGKSVLGRLSGACAGRLLHHFELKIQFLATADHRQIELPKLAREPKRRPALIEVHNEL